MLRILFIFWYCILHTSYSYLCNHILSTLIYHINKEGTMDCKIYDIEILVSKNVTSVINVAEFRYSFTNIWVAKYDVAICVSIFYITGSK